MQIEYTTSYTEEELQQILVLQKNNLPATISMQEAIQQGFVTVQHDFSLLQAMNEPYPHIIAKVDNKVIAYTLVMLRKFGNQIPVLKPMFQLINQLNYANSTLRNTNYFVMGQVCIDKAYRGKGIFSGLYEHMKKVMAPHFDYIITEIATRNTRSMRAHEKVGFKVLHTYTTADEEWAIVIWDWE